MEKTEEVKITPRKNRYEVDFEISYKNYEQLARFLNDRARIIGRSRSGLSPKQQRKLTREIKRARHLGLLPYKSKI